MMRTKVDVNVEDKSVAVCRLKGSATLWINQLIGGVSGLKL